MSIAGLRSPQAIAELARQTLNRGDVHVFLGHPAVELCDTTTVEPGNRYPPGMWTSEVSFWLQVGDQILTADRRGPETMDWGFGANRGPPLLRRSAGLRMWWSPTISAIGGARAPRASALTES